MGKVHCLVHTSKVYVGYCQDCEIRVCIECMMGQHKSHECIQLNKLIEFKTNEMSNFVAEFQKLNLNIYQENMAELEKQQQKYKAQIQILISKIQNRAEEIKHEIDILRDELVREISQIEKEDLKLFKQMENKMNQEHADLKTLIQGSDLQKIPEGADAIQYVSERKQTLSQNKVNNLQTNLMPPSFVTMETKIKELKKVFGYFSKEENKFKNFKSEMGNSHDSQSVDILSILSTRQHPSRIAAMSDDELWVSDSNLNGNLSLVQRNGHVIKTSATKFMINDLAVTASGDLLLTDGYNSKVVCMKQTGEFVDYLSTAPDTPWGLCVTDTSDIMVTLCQNVGSNGKIIRVSADKQIQQPFRNSNGERDLFILPHYITQNKNKDFWIQDKGYHHVIVVNQSGKERFTYRGPSGIKMGSAFDPYDLTSTPNGEVIIADHANATLHLVDKDGHFLRYIMTGKDGLCGPYALSMTTHSVLWISDVKLKQIFAVKCLES